MFEGLFEFFGKIVESLGTIGTTLIIMTFMIFLIGIILMIFMIMNNNKAETVVIDGRNVRHPHHKPGYDEECSTCSVENFKKHREENRARRLAAEKEV